MLESMLYVICYRRHDAAPTGMSGIFDLHFNLDAADHKQALNRAKQQLGPEYLITGVYTRRECVTGETTSFCYQGIACEVAGEAKDPDITTLALAGLELEQSRKNQE